MENKQIGKYLGAILLHTQEIAYGYDKLREIFRGEKDTRELFHAYIYVRSILGAAAVISKIMEPSSSTSTPIAQRRGAALREAVGFTRKDYPTLSDRKVRNGFDHYDERLDQYIDIHEEWFVDLNIDSIQIDNENNSGSAAPRLRHIISTPPFTVTMFDQSLDLMPLVGDVVRLGDKAAEWLKADTESLRAKSIA